MIITILYDPFGVLVFIPHVKLACYVLVLLSLDIISIRHWSQNHPLPVIQNNSLFYNETDLQIGVNLEKAILKNNLFRVNIFPPALKIQPMLQSHCSRVQHCPALSKTISV